MDELMIDATLDNVDAVLDFINERLTDCPPKIRNRISIAVDEIFANIARYAYHPATGAATVRITVAEDVTIEFEDQGMAYNPLTAGEPDITLSVEEREIGGLGIYLVKNLMDSVEYRREDGKNILVITSGLR